MLKLEHKNHTGELLIRLKSRTSFFTPLLLKAFIIAFCAHLLSLILFSISTHKSSDPYLLLPPSMVEIDSSIHQRVYSLNTSKIDSHGFLTYSFENPIKSVPSIPTATAHLSDAHLHSSSSSITPIDLPDNLIDLKVCHPESEINSGDPTAPTYLIVNFAGGLTGCRLKDRCVKKLQQILRSLSLTSPVTLQYAVEIEDKTGKVYEWKLLPSSFNGRTFLAGEAIIKALRIEAPKEKFLQEGIIELTILTEESEASAPQILWKAARP